MDNLAALAGETVRLREQQRQIGLQAIEILRSADPQLVSRLLELYGTAEQAASWLVDQIPALGFRTPVELLAEGRREAVLQSVHAQLYGLGA